MKAIITVLGKDKTGIISEVSSVLAKNNVNILDISQTILQEYFTMIMLVNLSSCKLPFNDLKCILDAKGKDIKVSIKIQHEDIFNSMHNI